MLVLGRRINEQIVIRVGGRVIRLEITDIRGSYRKDNRLVRIGFHADPDITVDRVEVDRAKRREVIDAEKQRDLLTRKP